MNKIEFGDCREIMRAWAAKGIKAQTCVTSPPYFGLRDYGVAGQLGLEQTPEEYIAAMVEVFRCVRDVLADDGTLWLNIGDSYAGARGTQPPRKSGNAFDTSTTLLPQSRAVPAGIKPKDLIGIPWMLAFALRADGWFLRQDIVWHKTNPMPESVRDRCTKAHEYIFLLSKSEQYFYDQEAVLEPCSPNTHARLSQDIQRQVGSVRAHGTGKTNASPMKAVGRKYDPGAGNKNNASFDAAMAIMPTKRNKRSVWTVATRPYKGAHFATFPPRADRTLHSCRISSRRHRARPVHGQRHDGGGSCGVAAPVSRLRAKPRLRAFAGAEAERGIRQGRPFRCYLTTPFTKETYAQENQQTEPVARRLRSSEGIHHRP